MAEEKREVVTAENWGKSRSSDLTMKVSLDVSEALTGLKAVQREAREATKALRELEAAQEYVGGVDIATTGGDYTFVKLMTHPNTDGDSE